MISQNSGPLGQSGVPKIAEWFFSLEKIGKLFFSYLASLKHVARISLRLLLGPFALASPNRTYWNPKTCIVFPPHICTLSPFLVDPTHAAHTVAESMDIYSSRLYGTLPMTIFVLGATGIETG